LPSSGGERNANLQGFEAILPKTWQIFAREPVLAREKIDLFGTKNLHRDEANPLRVG